MAGDQDYDIPEVEDGFKSNFKAILYVWKYSIPSVIFTSAYYICDLISYHYLGDTNPPKVLAAYGLTLSWVSAFGILILYAIGAGISIYAGHAFGQRDYALLREIYKFGYFVMFLVGVVISIFLFFSADILYAIGIEEELASLCQPLFRAQILVIITGVVVLHCRYFANALGHFHIAGISMIITTLIHWGLTALFVRTFNFGATMVVVAKGLSLFTTIPIFLFYFKYYHVIPKTEQGQEHLEESDEGTEKVEEPPKVSFSKLLKLSISQGSSIYLEYIHFEIVQVTVAVFQSAAQISAFVININLYQLKFSFYFSICIILNSIFSNLVGQMREEKLKRYLRIGIISSASVCFVVVVVNLILSAEVFEIYTDDNEVIQLSKQLLPWTSLTLFLDSITYVLVFCLRSLNEPNFVIKSLLISYYLISMSIVLILIFTNHVDSVQIWQGIIAGNLSNMAICTWKLKNLDWSLNIQKVGSEFVENEEQKKDL